MRYNTIVVGAGPSGSTAAYHLAKRRKKVLLLEAQKLPRFKACGGGVSQKLVDSLPVDVSAAVRGKTTSIRFFNDNRTDPVDVQLTNPILMMDRAIFDHQLVKAAEGVGAEVLDSSRVIGVREQDFSVTVKTEQGEFVAKHLILADGVHDPVGRKLGFSKNRFISAMEFELPNFPADQSFTYWGLMPVKKGFAWVFPRQDFASVGILGMDSGPRLREELDNWLELWGYEAEPGQIHGHPIPLVDFTRAIQTKNIFLVGDAAGLADPLTGEGIKFAIMSGRFAAEAILSGRPSSYSWKVRTNIYPYFVPTSLFRLFVYRWTDFVYKHGVTNPLVQKLIVETFDRVK